MQKNVLRPLSILAALGIAASLAFVAQPAGAQGTPAWTPRVQSPAVALKGSGASFPNPVYQVWIAVYKQVNPSVSISYQSVGSGQGQRDFIGYLTDFGGTDSVVSTNVVAAQAPDTLHVPTVLGAVVPTYNVPGLAAGTQLRFSPDTLAGIYLGTITTWNNAAIVADNPGVTLPKTRITVVYRSDSSGTTSIWTDYLSKVNADWRSRAGTGTTVKWPVGIGAPGNAGVTSTVLRTSGAIGYVELVYALGNKLPVPFIKNAAGNFVLPTLENVSLAAAGATIPDDLRASITNATGANSYPIAAFTYMLVRQSTYTDAAKAGALADFIYWGLSDGQGAALRLGYAPLPTAVRTKAMAQLNKITVAGQQVFTQAPK